MAVWGSWSAVQPSMDGVTSETSRFGRILALWMALTIALEGALWLAGFPGSALAGAIERGAAQAEARGIGELSDDLIRKAIQTQHDTLPFWTTLTLLGDFLAEPFALAVRALVVATSFAALAALVGRPVRYDQALAECSMLQGIWVLGLAVRVALMVGLRRNDVETSAALFLPAGVYPAPVWLMLRQLDPFAIIGWTAMARGGWRRGQVHPAAAVTICLFLALSEAIVRVTLALMIGSAMRLQVTVE